MLLAGDFTMLHNTAFNGLAILKKTSSGIYNPSAALPIRVIVASNYLRISYESLEHPTQLSLYDLQGRLLAQQTLPPGDAEITLDAGMDWSSGLYVWQLQNLSGTRTGKWAVTR